MLDFFAWACYTFSKGEVMFNKKEKGNIYCSGCKYFVCNFLDTCCYYSGQSCYHSAEQIITKTKTPIRINKTSEYVNILNCEKINKYNDCPYFKDLLVNDES